jgi:predicted lipoprotein with Yx(FWY)xxD motif
VTISTISTISTASTTGGSRHRLGAALLAVGALTVAGCAGSSSTTSSGATSAGSTAAPATASPDTTARPTTTTPATDGMVVTIVNTPYGPALGTGAGPLAGLVLYTWDEEADGTIRCTGECAAKWPPLTADAITVGAGVDAARFTSVTRPDGARQVALDGRPLYTMALDRPGEANCQGGEGWWIRNPDGSVNQRLTPV